MARVANVMCHARALGWLRHNVCMLGQWAQLEAATDEYIVHVDAELAAAAALLVSGRDPPELDAASLSLGAT